MTCYFGVCVSSCYDNELNDQLQRGKIICFGTYCTDHYFLVCSEEVYAAVFPDCHDIGAFTHDPGAGGIITRVMVCSCPPLGNRYGLQWGESKMRMSAGFQLACSIKEKLKKSHCYLLQKAWFWTWIPGCLGECGTSSLLPLKMQSQFFLGQETIMVNGNQPQKKNRTLRISYYTYSPLYWNPTLHHTFLCVHILWQGHVNTYLSNVVMIPPFPRQVSGQYTTL